MSAVQAIIAKFETPAKFGRAINLKVVNHAHQMWDRMSIPSLRWPDVVEAAAERGIKGVTIEALMAAHVADEPLRRAKLQQARARQKSSSQPEARAS